LDIKRGSSSQQKIEIESATSLEEDTAEINTKVDIDTPTLRIYEDKHRLPVIYDISLREPKKRLKTETNNITVLWHELISPLTIIKGYTATLLQLNHLITEEQKEQYLKGIDAASNKIIRLLENLRDITKVEETDVLNLQRIFLHDLLSHVASDIQNQTTKHIIKLRPRTHLPLVNVDPEKLEIVVNNLLFNAIKYSPSGGDIEIDINLIRDNSEISCIFGEVPPIKLPCFIVSVADNGIGIPERELEQIFEKFYRVKNNLTNITSGAGLGLYICKIIVNSHGGYIWARNRLQGGSVFHFSLPVE